MPSIHIAGGSRSFREQYGSDYRTDLEFDIRETQMARR
jgi:hypothetical protein